MCRQLRLRLLMALWLPAVFTLASAAQESVQITPLSRLFTVPTGGVLGSYEVNLTLGGAYGSMNKGEYLGVASVGLGNVAEVEISTLHLVSNLFQSSTAMGTTALKIGLLHENHDPGLADIAVIFRLNPSWSKVNSNDRDLLPEIQSQVSAIHFEMHIASLYAAMSKTFGDGFRVHGGVYLMDLRTREGIANYVTEFPDMRKNLVSGFIGIERQVNPRTIIMAEVSGVPRYNYYPSTNLMTADQVALMIAGVRFNFAQRISADAGVRFRSDYVGIADADIAVGLNLGVNLYEMFTHKPMGQ